MGRAGGAAGAAAAGGSAFSVMATGSPAPGAGAAGGAGSAGRRAGPGSGRGEARRHARDSVHWSESSESESAPELVSLSSTATRRASMLATSRNTGAPRNVSYRPVFSSQRFSTLRSFIPSRMAFNKSDLGSG